MSARLNYFEKYLAIAPFSHALWRAVEAEELSRHKLKKPILDIGCGFGEFAGVFFNSQVEVGIDIDPNEILLAKNAGKYKKTIAADARKLPFDKNTFNTVISISTLEHISNNSKVLKEAYRVLKPGGLLIFISPTEQLYDNLLGVKLLNLIRAKNLSLMYFRLLNRAFKHVYLPNPKTWVENTRSAGFKILETSGTLQKSTIFLWELGIPLAMPSQIIKIITGRRIVNFQKLRQFLFKPLLSFTNSDPKNLANIIVVAQKPKK